MPTVGNRFLAYLLILALVSTTSGCSTTGSKFTGQQKQQLETSIVEGSYNNVFNAVRTVFLNENLIVKDVSKESGFIRGTVDVARGAVTKGRVAWTGFWILLIGVFALLTLPFTFKSRGEKEVSITANLVDLGDNNVEVRLQTPLLQQQTESYGIGLKRIFAEVKKQTMILEAAGRV
jgi:hypothetical protein